MASRVVLLLLAFLLSLSVSQLAQFLIMGVGSILPGGLSMFFGLSAFALGHALQFFCSGVLFTVAVGMPWRQSALWTWLGIGLCNKLAAGPGAFSADAWSAQFTTVVGLAAVAISAAASFYGCLWAERREHEPWAEQARAMLLGFFNRGSR